MVEERRREPAVQTQQVVRQSNRNPSRYTCSVTQYQMLTLALVELNYLGDAHGEED